MATPQRLPDDIEQQIRQCVANGLGKKETVEYLGISRYALRKLTSAMPDLRWICRSHTQSRLALYEAMRREPKYRERILRAKQAQLDNLRVHEIDGVRGSIGELCEHFGDRVAVCHNTVRVRVNKGWALRDALFQPPYPTEPSPGQSS